MAIHEPVEPLNEKAPKGGYLDPKTFFIFDSSYLVKMTSGGRIWRCDGYDFYNPKGTISINIKDFKFLKEISQTRPVNELSDFVDEVKKDNPSAHGIILQPLEADGLNYDRPIKKLFCQVLDSLGIETKMCMKRRIYWGTLVEIRGARRL